MQPLKFKENSGMLSSKISYTKAPWLFFAYNSKMEKQHTYQFHKIVCEYNYKAAQNFKAFPI